MNFCCDEPPLKKVAKRFGWLWGAGEVLCGLDLLSRLIVYLSENGREQSSSLCNDVSGF
jgi:hypothetical protein